MSLFDLFKKKEFKPETFSGTDEFLHVNTLDDTLQKFEKDLGPVVSSLAAGGQFAYDTIAPAFTMIFDSPEVGAGSDVIPEGKMFIDPYVTGTSMPKYTSLDPDPDLFTPTIK